MLPFVMVFVISHYRNPYETIRISHGMSAKRFVPVDPSGVSGLLRQYDSPQSLLQETPVGDC